MPLTSVKTQRAIPGSIADGTAQKARGGRYGERYVIPITSGLYGIAEEGQYFKACNPTMGTGIAMGIQTSFSDTANVLALMRNTAGAGGKSIYLDYIRLVCTATGASTTSAHLAVVLDNANRYSSGGTDLTAQIVNCNTEGAPTSITDIRFGIVTAAAAVNKRQVARMALKAQAAPCWVVGDEVILNFGAQDSSKGLLSGAAAACYAKSIGPMILGPGSNHSLLLHMWNVANATTAPSWEVEMGFFER